MDLALSLVEATIGNVEVEHTPPALEPGFRLKNIVESDSTKLLTNLIDACGVRCPRLRDIFERSNIRAFENERAVAV